jgi:hypothetical protein
MADNSELDDERPFSLFDSMPLKNEQKNDIDFEMSPSDKAEFDEEINAILEETEKFDLNIKHKIIPQDSKENIPVINITREENNIQNFENLFFDYRDKIDFSERKEFIDPILLEDVKKHVNLHNEKIKEDKSVDNECSVCLEDIQENDKANMSCSHFLCIKCYDKLDSQVATIIKKRPKHGNMFRIGLGGETNLITKLCPMCRKQIKLMHRSETNKYAIMCLNKPTRHNVFFNGGYTGCLLLLYPEEKWTEYNNVTYQDNKKFEFGIEKLFLDGYVVFVQDYDEVCHWLKEIQLKDFLMRFDKKIIRYYL